MSEDGKNKNNIEILMRVYEHCQYTYEQEKARTTRLDGEVKLALAFLVFAVGLVVLRIMPDLTTISRLTLSDTQNCFLMATVLFFLVCSLLLFFLSLTFTIRVMRVWSYERLCDPEESIKLLTKMPSEEDALVFIINDYAFAANKYHEVNESRSDLLYKGVRCLLFGTISFAAGIALYHLNAM